MTEVRAPSLACALDLLDCFRFQKLMLRPAALFVFAARWWRWNVEGGVPIER